MSPFPSGSSECHGSGSARFVFPNTLIDVVGSASDDAGRLNAGARIAIRGNATNGVANAMVQGKSMSRGISVRAG